MLRLYGPRAMGVEGNGALHSDGSTSFDATWYEDEDSALHDIEETAQLCGYDAAQNFALVQIDLDLPSWWDHLTAAMQAAVLAELLRQLPEYPTGYSEVKTWTGADLAPIPSDD